MVDFDLQPEEFRALLDTVDGTVLGLPEKVMAVTAAGEELAGALRDSDCAPAVRFFVEEVLRQDLLHVTFGCENVVGAGHAVRAALVEGDTRMAEDAVDQAVR
jgi:hypothetical protein